MTKRTQLICAALFGVSFILILIILAIEFPHPTEFQYLVFRLVLALAAAGIAAMLPGSLDFHWNSFIRAGGAMAVFAAVYFMNPARIAVQAESPTKVNENANSVRRTEALNRELDAIQSVNASIVEIAQAGRSLFRAGGQAIQEMDRNHRPGFTYGCPPQLLQSAGELYKARDKTWKLIDANRHVIDPKLAYEYVRYINFVAWDHDFLSDESYWNRGAEETLIGREVEIGKSYNVSPAKLIVYSKCFELGQHVVDHPEAECVRYKFDAAKAFFTQCTEVGEKAFEYQDRILDIAQKAVCAKLGTCGEQN